MLSANLRISMRLLANGYADGAIVADGTCHALRAPHSAVMIFQRMSGNSAGTWAVSLPRTGSSTRTASWPSTASLLDSPVFMRSYCNQDSNPHWYLPSIRGWHTLGPQTTFMAEIGRLGGDVMAIS